MSTTEEILNATFKKVGNDFGYETSAEYAAFRDLKVRWQRSYKWADFQVSDYLKDAPVEVLESLARMFFTKIQGDECSYSDKVIEWLTAPEFVDTTQPIFIERDHRISFEEGEHKSLEEALDRLKEKGFIGDLGKTRIFWSNEATSGRGGWSSALMKVVMVNKALDSGDVPDEVLDAVILNKVANIECDFAMSPMDRKRTIDDRMKLYPGFDGISEWLYKHGLEA
jgi:hypothetical protein